MTKATERAAKYAEFERILTAAHDAAKQAQVGMVEGQGLDCGFAWVTLPGTHPLARYCRDKIKALEAETGHHDAAERYGRGGSEGHMWWKPGCYYGQSIGIHEAGARAFHRSLGENNISATVGSRFD